MLSILVESLTESEAKKLIRRLKMTGRWVRVINDTQSVKKVLKVLAKGEIRNSKIFHLLSHLDVATLEAMCLISNSNTLRSNLRLFLDNMRFVTPRLKGDDLIQLGFTEGPIIGKVLERLANLVIDGLVKTKEDEMNVAREILKDI